MKSLAELLGSIKPPRFEHACPACGAPSIRLDCACPECEAAQRLAREAKARTTASIPERFAWASSLEVPELSMRVDGAALAAACALDLPKLDRVTLLGPAGTGKTSVAAAITNAWVRVTARPARFVSAVDLGVARQQHGLGDGEAGLVRQAMSAALLLLDDVGQECAAGTPAVAHVIQHRYDEASPTIATSGLAVEQIVARYGAGVARRLVETAGGAVVLKLAASGPPKRAE